MSEELNNKKIALIFTRGISLKTWESLGSLSREVKPYEVLSQSLSQISFFTYGGEDDEKILKKTNLKVFPKRVKIPNLLYSLILPIVYRREFRSIDIIKTNQMDGAWTAVIAKILFRKKLVVRCGYQLSKTVKQENSPFWKQWLIYLIEKNAYAMADSIIVTSKTDIPYLQKRYKIPKNKINLVPNYIDTKLFTPLEQKKEKRTLSFVGRFKEIKNLKNLFLALSGLNIKLILFGTGPQEDELIALAQEKNLTVQFRGNIPNEKLPEELNKTEAFILPSWREGNPKVLLEAMSCGLPCIGTKVEGIAELIDHNQNGLLCGTSANSIRQAINNLFSDKKLQKKLGTGARQTILDQFSLEKIIQKELSIYKQFASPKVNNSRPSIDSQSKKIGPKTSVFVFGQDGAGWSIDKDRKAAERFIRLAGFNLTTNILKADYIYCVWYDLLLRPRYIGLFIFLKFILRKKIIAVITNDIRNYPAKIKKLNSLVDRYVVPSQSFSDYLSKKSCRKNIIMPFFVDPEIFNRLPLSRDQIITKLKLDKEKITNKIVIGSFQRDSLGADLTKAKWQKDPDLQIKILRRLPKRQFTLLLAGPRRHYIINQCRRYGIDYLFLGDESFIDKGIDDMKVNNLDEKTLNYLYNISDLYLITSKSEGGPKQIIESALTDTLILSTDVGLAKDFIHPDLIFSENNLQRPVEIIKNFKTNSSQVKKYLEYNYKTARAKMDKNYIKSKYQEILGVK